MLELLNELASLGVLTVRDPSLISHGANIKMDPGLLATLASEMTENILTPCSLLYLYF